MKLYTCVMCVGCGANLVGIYVNHNRFLFHHSFSTHLLRFSFTYSTNAFSALCSALSKEAHFPLLRVSRRSCLVYKISNSFFCHE